MFVPQLTTTQMTKERFYPLILFVVLWHFKCIYSWQIESFFWFIDPLPTTSGARFFRIFGVYLVAFGNILYQLSIKNNKIDSMSFAFAYSIILSSLGWLIIYATFVQN